MILWFSATLFLSSTLLFLVQPMVGRMILPALGGTPAVWNTCMVFFQAALLAGYAYAHVSVRWFGVRRQVVIHIVLLLTPLLLLPIRFAQGASPPTDDDPTPWLLWQMLISVGLPFFLVSTSAPLLQRWFVDTGHPAARDPYFLYAASNLGSLLALLGYPLLFEPTLGLAQLFPRKITRRVQVSHSVVGMSLFRCWIMGLGMCCNKLRTVRGPLKGFSSFCPLMPNRTRISGNK